MPQQIVPGALIIREMPIQQWITSTYSDHHQAEHLAEMLGEQPITITRVSNTQMREMVQAADLAGLPLADWVVDIVLTAARAAIQVEHERQVLAGLRPPDEQLEIPW